MRGTRVKAGSSMEDKFVSGNEVRLTSGRSGKVNDG